MNPPASRQLTSVERHRERILALLPPRPPVDVPLDAADGLVVARDVLARAALPPFDNSAMDGYAVRAAEIASASQDAPVVLPVADDIPAGKTDVRPMTPGTVHRIMTGAPVPPGADSVVPVEWTDGATDRVRIRQAPRLGQHVRSAGEELSAGDVALPAGTPLAPAQLGLAAAVGHATVSANPRPRVVVLSTGSELIAPGGDLLPGQIFESNSPMLVAAARRAGAEARAITLVPDDVPRFRAALAEVAADADLIITSGGVSAGAYEVVKDALLDGGTVVFDKVAMQPGMPQGAGTVDGTPIVTLPGNPVSVYVSFEAFVRPALRRMLGYAETGRPVRRGVFTPAAGTPQASPPGRRQFLRGHFDPETGAAGPIGAPPSHLLASLARADCLIVVGEDVTEIGPGDDVEIWLLDGAT